MKDASKFMEFSPLLKLLGRTQLAIMDKIFLLAQNNLLQMLLRLYQKQQFKKQQKQRLM